MAKWSHQGLALDANRPIAKGRAFCGTADDSDVLGRDLWPLHLHSLFVTSKEIEPSGSRLEYCVGIRIDLSNPSAILA